MELRPRALSAALKLLLLLCSCCPRLAMSEPHSNVTDLESLLAFKASVADPDGILANSWNSSVPFCSWTGVYCNLRRRRVLALQLNSFYLGGTISPHLANLSFLSVLDLRNNSLTGSFPEDFTRLPGIAELKLDYNQLTGPIPPGVFNMSSLTNISFFENDLSGPLPTGPDSFNLPNLRWFALAYNRLTGRIPPSIAARCPRLKKLNFAFNNFTGTIPSELGNMTTLEVLWLGVNQLTGPIPASLGNLTNLVLFELSNNNLEGTIPDEFGNLVRLEGLMLMEAGLTGSIRPLLNASRLDYLQLIQNNFTGPIPAELGRSLPRLKNVNMDYNQLTGGLEFIASLSHCRNLELIDLSRNKIEGVLPDSVGNLSSNLLYFVLEENYIKGSIPAAFGNLTSLILLDLLQNELEGAIPSSLSKLSRLQQLELSMNRLTGAIPSELGTMPSLNGIFLSGNALSGPIPKSLGGISTLQHVVLGDNLLSSTIPINMWRLTDLIALDLSRNALEGPFPHQIGDLKSLAALDLSRNRLSSDIPSSLGNLQMLTYLDLSCNALRGEIPQSIGRLIVLESLNLSHNALSGVVPESMANLKGLASLDLSFNKLEGHIPAGKVFSNLSISSLEGNTALCGLPRLGFSPCTPKASASNSKIKMHLLKYVLPPVSSVVILLLCSCLLLVYLRRRTKSVSPSKDRASLNNLRVVTYHELVRATDNFSDANLLGKGSVGSVFKACLDDGLTVAVKVLDVGDEAASKSFDAECSTLSQVRHRNLVKIISTCSNLDFKSLVLEFMPNGSLDKWLYSHNYCLDLLQRLNIMVDVSLALEYLHHHHPSVMVHRDLKPGNVLLDEDMVAHVGDFGIAKMLLGDDTSVLSASAPGTLGYMAPEYGFAGEVSRKGDVYSFGILMLETLTRKKPSDPMFGGELSLRQWVSNAYPNAVLEIVDCNLLTEVPSSSSQPPPQAFTHVRRCLTAIIELGLACSSDSPRERTLMVDVVPILGKIKTEYVSNLTVT